MSKVRKALKVFTNYEIYINVIDDDDVIDVVVVWPNDYF